MSTKVSNTLKNSLVWKFLIITVQHAKLSRKIIAANFSTTKALSYGR